MSMVPMMVALNMQRQNNRKGGRYSGSADYSSKFITVMLSILIVMFLSAAVLLATVAIQDTVNATPITFQSEIIKVEMKDTVKYDYFYVYIKDYDGEIRRINVGRNKYYELEPHVGEVVTINAEISSNFISGERTVNHNFSY